MTDQNPLLNQTHLLAFDAIKPEHITPAIKQLLADCERTLSEVTAPETPATWQDVIEPLDRVQERLGRAWGAVGHLMGVMDSQQLRNAYNENLQAVTVFSILLSQNEALYGKMKAIFNSDAFKSLSAQKQRVLEKALLDFRLSGAELPNEEKAKLQAIGEQSAQLTQAFSEHLLDATNNYHLDLPDTTRLSGIPDSVLALYKAQAEAAGIEGYRITLQYPSYLPLMKYAEDRELRHDVFYAFSTRASELGPKEIDNGPLISKILHLRYQEAKLLGFDTYADVSLVKKMAPSPSAVTAFLRDLASRSKPYAERDNEELKTFAKNELGLESLEPWDRAYASEKLREARYAFSDEEVRNYFTLPAVFNGLFRLVERLYSIRIEPDTAPLWHKDVQFWRINDANGHLLAQFYTDLYARPSKRGGAWMDNDLSRRKRPDGSIETPTAYLVCNFTQPVDGKPSLLTHDEVTTLFHEFGHGLHHMLTVVDEADLSGINGVEWDAVEMPSQFMENWCWNYDTVKTLTSHVDTGDCLPKALFDKMLAAKNFQSGLFSVRQLEFALFDMLIHMDEEKYAKDFMATLKSVQNEVAVSPAPAFSRFPQSFSHIFAGGYAAGYYSYKWAEVLSSDAFAAFEEEGLFNPETGKRWLNEVLSVGSTRPIMDSFVAFRGREPKIDALLRHSGMDGKL